MQQNNWFWTVLTFLQVAVSSSCQDLVRQEQDLPASDPLLVFSDKCWAGKAKAKSCRFCSFPSKKAASVHFLAAASVSWSDIQPRHFLRPTKWLWRNPRRVRADHETEPVHSFPSKFSILLIVVNFCQFGGWSLDQGKPPLQWHAWSCTRTLPLVCPKDAEAAMRGETLGDLTT